MPFAAIFTLPKGLGEWGRLVLAVLVTFALTAPLAYCKGEDAAESRAAAARAEANVEALKTNTVAVNQAATERLEDATTVAENEKELIDAIQDTPDTAPDAVRVQLGCERLRKAGTDPANLPASCGPGR